MDTTNKTVKADSTSAKGINQAVEQAYLSIITEVKRSLALFPTEELRTYVERTGTNNDSRSFYSPLIYISVADYFGKRMISFAKNFRVKPHIGNTLDTMLTRIIYKHTGIEITKTSVEDRLEEYLYQPGKYEDALRHSTTLENYKKDTVHPAKP